MKLAQINQFSIKLIWSVPFPGGNGKSTQAGIGGNTSFTFFIYLF